MPWQLAYPKPNDRNPLARTLDRLVKGVLEDLNAGREVAKHVDRQYGYCAVLVPERGKTAPMIMIGLVITAGHPGLQYTRDRNNPKAVGAEEQIVHIGNYLPLKFVA